MRIGLDLRNDGIATAHIRDFFDDASFTELRACADRLIAAGEEEPEAKEQKKPFFTYYLGGHIGSAPKFEIGNPFMRFILCERFLEIAGAYFDFAPTFSSFALLQTHRITRDSGPEFSQRWHRDPDDKMILKIFLYLSDVNEGAGPFNFVCGSHHTGRWRSVAPQVPPVGSYPKDGEVENRVSKADISSYTGSAGTIIFADTSGLHRGGYCTDVERLHFVGGFVSRASVQPIGYVLADNTSYASLSLLARYAIGKNR